MWRIYSRHIFWNIGDWIEEWQDNFASLRTVDARQHLNNTLQASCHATACSTARYRHHAMPHRAAWYTTSILVMTHCPALTHIRAQHIAAHWTCGAPRLTVCFYSGVRTCSARQVRDHQQQQQQPALYHATSRSMTCYRHHAMKLRNETPLGAK